MAAISVVTFGSPHKILQNSNTNRNDIMIVRKTSEKATRKPRREITRVSNPTPIAVARRNARERNRVKQVNNGFAALRQHIPPEIAAAFEQQVGHGRSGNKKLSKVETLRMAVEYIRSLEEILSSDDSSDNGGNNSISSRTSTINFPSPKSNSSQAYSYTTISDDQHSDSTSPKTFQYIRISENDTYQLITSTNDFSTFEDEENIQPIVDNLSTNSDVFVDSPLTEMVFEPYGDEHSLSPGPNTHESADVSSYVRQFTTLPPIEVLHPRNIIQSNILISPSLSSNHSLSPKLLSPSAPQSYHPTSVITSVAHQSILYSPESDCTIKLESPEHDLALEEGVVKTEEMVDVMDWWNNSGKLTSNES